MSLFDAIEHGELQEVRQEIRKGADLGELDEATGITPLALAAELGHVDLVELLIRAGADVNRGGATTPLEAAVLEGHLDAASVLIEARAEVDRAVDEGFTPLMTAANTGNLEMVKLLINAGARPDLLNSDGHHAAQLAAKEGYKEIAAFLTPKATDEPEVTGEEETIHHAISRRDVHRVAAWIDSGASAEELDSKHRTPLFLAVREGQPEIVDILIEAGADVGDGSRESPLYLAARSGQDALVEILLEAGARVDPRSKDPQETALIAAASAGHREIVEMLLEAGASARRTDTEGLTALDHAAASGHKNIFEALTAKATKKVCEKAVIALEEAIAQRLRAVGSAAELIALIESGDISEVDRRLAQEKVDLEEADEEGKTLLMTAAWHGRHELIEKLIELGARLDPRDHTSFGATALIRAIRGVSSEREKTAALLARAGADVNQPCVRGLTPLMHAVEADVQAEGLVNGHFGVTTRTLLELGADLEAEDEQGNTVWALTKRNTLGASTFGSRRRRLHQMLRLLETSGALRS